MMGLTDIFQIMSMSAVRMIKITRDDQVGTVWLQSGEVVNVRWGQSQGREAFFEVL